MTEVGEANLLSDIRHRLIAHAQFRSRTIKSRVGDQFGGGAPDAALQDAVNMRRITSGEARQGYRAASQMLGVAQEFFHRLAQPQGPGICLTAALGKRAHEIEEKRFEIEGRRGPCSQVSCPSM